MLFISGRRTANDFEVFNPLELTQNMCPPFFLSTITIGKLQRDSDLSTIPYSNMSLTASSTSSLLWRSVQYSFNVIGMWLPVSIFILTVCVCPKSLSELTTTSLLALSSCPTQAINFPGAIISSSFTSPTISAHHILHA